MEICENCGNSIPDGRRFCTKCGKPVTPTSIPAVDIGPPPPASAFETPDTGMEVYDPKKHKREKEKVTGLGFSAEAVAEAEQIAKEIKKQETAAPQAKKTSKEGEAPAGQIDEELIDQILQEDEQKRRSTIKIDLKPLFKGPTLYLSIGTLLLIPALILPWFYFYDGTPLSAFRLPVVFLFSDRVFVLTKFTVGLTVAAIFLADVALTAYPRRIVTFMQFFAFVTIGLAAGMLLLGLRHWNAMNGLGPVYEQYLQHRDVALPEDPVPMLLIGNNNPGPAATGTIQAPATGTPRVPVAAPRDARPYIPRQAADSELARTVAAAAKRMPAGTNQTNFIVFFFRVLGPGFIFALISGIVIIWSSMRHAGKLRHIEFVIPAAVGALLIVVVGALLILFLFARISPARWYYTQNSFYRMIGNNDAGTKRLKVCVEVPAPDYLCRKELARAYWESNKIKNALALYLDVIKEKPNFPEARRDLADLYFAGKNYWKAAEQYRKYLAMRPGVIPVKEKLSTCLVYMGNKYYSQHRYTKAARVYAEALQTLDRNKTDHVLQYKTGDSFLRLGKLNEALVHFSASADLQPQAFDLHIKVAKLYELKRDYVKALTYYKKSIEAKPDNTQAYIYIAEIYRYKYKDKTQACVWYKKGIAANPVSDAAPVARKALEMLQY